MSNEAVHSGPDASYKAAAALAKYTSVKLDSAANTVAQSTANTDVTVGFTQNPVTVAGEPVTVRVAGYSLAVCSGGWTKGDKLTPTTAGALVTTTTAAHKVCAIALEAASAGEYGEVLIVSPALRYDTF